MDAIDRRIGLLFIGFAVLLAFAVLRSVDLGVIQAAPLRRAAVSEHITDEPLPAMRGTITSANGVVLALSEAADDVIVDPYLTVAAQPATSARKLASLLGMPFSTVLATLTKPHAGYAVLAAKVTPATARRVMALGINGVSLNPDVRRVYPMPWSASQVLGGVYANLQPHGVPAGSGDAGIELQYNPVLSGSSGERRIVADELGQTVSVDEVRPMRAGRSLTVTLNSALQNYVEQVLTGVGAEWRPKGATAIVMSPSTGSILALANWPRVNAYDPGGAPSQDLMDKAVGYSYEPGSTFKAFTVSAAIQDGLVTPGTEIYVPSILHVYNRTIQDAELHPSEYMSVAQILKVSSNIGAVEIGKLLGAARFSAWVRRFGFGERTGIDLPGEQTGIVPQLSQYSGVSMANLPFGQGQSVTPIQMATAYSAIANGGMLRAPHVVSAIGGRSVALPPAHRIVSQTTAAEIRDMLRGVLADGGTASGAAIPGYDLAGKTGTAQVAINGSYSKTEFVGSFIGMVPAADPKLVVAVMVDEPQGGYYGAQVAAPAFKKIVEWAVPYFGIHPNPAHVDTSQPAG
ncbi:MAG: peptidoglycan D,D-transpeptidase FtsI family protein [Solirubrobacteraceae bacterium]